MDPIIDLYKYDTRDSESVALSVIIEYKRIIMRLMQC
jgi:hypothetical protein